MKYTVFNKDLNKLGFQQDPINPSHNIVIEIPAGNTKYIIARHCYLTVYKNVNGTFVVDNINQYK